MKIKFKSKCITPVPPCFTERIARCLCLSLDPGAILKMCLCNRACTELPCIARCDLFILYVQFYKSLQQDESNPCLHSKYLLQFLWLDTCGDVEISVRSYVPVHPKLDNFFNDRLECLPPSSPPQSTNINNSFVTATNRLTVVIKDASLVMQQAEKKQKGWDSLMSKVQNLFLFAPSTNFSDLADSPSVLLRKILEVTGTAAVVNRLQLLFMSKFGFGAHTPFRCS